MSKLTLPTPFITGFYQRGDSGGDEAEALPVSAAWKLQDSCLDQAYCRLWVHSLSHNAKITFEETCPFYFQLLVLDGL